MMIEEVEIFKQSYKKSFGMFGKYSGVVSLK